MPRRTVLAFVSLAAVLICALVGARTAPTTSRVKLRLVDSKTGQPITGIVRIVPAGEKTPLVLDGAFDRFRGLNPTDAERGWYVIPTAGHDVELPRAKLMIEALSGLETALTRREFESVDQLDVPVDYLFRPAELGLIAGNTHLHLRGLSRADSDEYLRRIPAADGIAIQFISYLERVKDDASYITNEYPTGDLTDAIRAQGVVINNGEEYRHNFGAGGQGYGHVMFLNMKERILPASVGPGITGQGTDDTPLRGGIDAARGQGSTVLWCHNTFGVEGVPSVLTGRVDALNVFDGSRRDTFDDKYYRYLNVGLRLPISTGTDWFMYDFSRVYVQAKGQPTVPAWLDALKAGRAVATNGPLLTLSVDGQPPGSVIAIDKAKSLKVEATGLGRHDFEQIELVKNGKVIVRERAKAVAGGFQAKLAVETAVDAPAWFAIRVVSKTKNELGQAVFAHTSPVYVDFAGRRTFDVEDALTLLKLVETGREEIIAKGTFAMPEGRKKVLDIHDEAIAWLKAKLNERK